MANEDEPDPTPRCSRNHLAYRETDNTTNGPTIANGGNRAGARLLVATNRGCTILAKNFILSNTRTVKETKNRVKFASNTSHTNKPFSTTAVVLFGGGKIIPPCDPVRSSLGGPNNNHCKARTTDE